MTATRADRVLFVSAGMPAPKKRDHPLARRQLYLNYGALTLATQLKRAGRDTVLVHGGHVPPAEFLGRLRASAYLPSRHPIMLSLPSFYALPWAQEFARLAKAADPGCRIVAGGRWVVGPDEEWFRTRLPDADVLVPGLGEPVIESLAAGGTPPGGRLQASTPSFGLDHRLVEGYAAFQPSVEASRGCGMGCAFCEERDIRLEPLRSPAEMARHLEDVTLQYGSFAIHPYFQSSFFAPNTKWAERFAAEVAARSLRVSWRTESRVDAVKPATVAALASAGLKVLDLGLESAPPSQILAMAKSPKPQTYLRRASELLRACRENGVWVKANVLLYAGESRRTLDETTAWLDEHRDCIKGVSVGPVIAFGPPKTARMLLGGWERLGARAVAPDSAGSTGITHVHLGPGMDAAEAELASLEISRRYMASDDYFDLKSFSYYPRGFTRDEFLLDVEASDRTLLPFSHSVRAAPGLGHEPSRRPRAGAAA